MSKLTELIKVAKAATPGPWETDDANPHLVARYINGVYHYILAVDPSSFSSTETTGEQDDAVAAFISLANPATLLELCALLERAEEALQTCESMSDCNNDGVSYKAASNVITAIKQWKEKT